MESTVSAISVVFGVSCLFGLFFSLFYCFLFPFPLVVVDLLQLRCLEIRGTSVVRDHTSLSPYASCC